MLLGLRGIFRAMRDARRPEVLLPLHPEGGEVIRAARLRVD